MRFRPAALAVAAAAAAVAIIPASAVALPGPPPVEGTGHITMWYKPHYCLTASAAVINAPVIIEPCAVKPTNPLQIWDISAGDGFAIIQLSVGGDDVPLCLGQNDKSKLANAKVVNCSGNDPAANCNLKLTPVKNNTGCLISISWNGTKYLYYTVPNKSRVKFGTWWLKSPQDTAKYGNILVLPELKPASTALRS